MMRDRERDRESVRAARTPAEQLESELRPRVHLRHELVIEHGHPRGLEYDPTDFGRHVDSRRIPPPGAEHVGISDQLDGASAEYLDFAAEQPVNDEEALVVDVGLERLGGLPLTGR